ncbi:MAG TPA: glycosyltransferase family 2 protein [Acidimicrobiales bacterium]|nr:glycosyltransferase family 2 protein [Acidimicrobiales bacterium]
METLAPPVVAVVVAHDPGPWFEETLTSLAAQDYAELSVLVLDSGGRDDLTARVAAVLPTAYVRRFEKNRGFGATVNEVQAMVAGADYFLLCHDDVALSSDAVHLMVEEAFRSNAGIVSPKVVSWDDPERLVHVGMMVDKGGSVVERVQAHEIDHGQHDAVRDVFVAPGGSTLIRADLFEELGGFDTDIVAMGEDLDLCWRAQVAGARIIVAPDAQVRHLEVLAGGSRPMDAALVSAGPGRPSRHPVTLQELQRRHELLAVFKCYSRLHLVRVVPQIAILALGEVIVAGVAGNRARARAVVRAWRWNLGRLSAIGRQRKELKGHRRLSDKEIRLLQVGGSARLSTYGRRVFQSGFHGAHADELAAAEGARPSGAGPTGTSSGWRRPVAGGMAPGAVGEPAQAVSGRGRVTPRVRATVWLSAAVVALIGSRGVVSGHLPAVGQFTPFPSWSSTLSMFASGWRPSGVGTTAPASPALGLAGLAGTLVLGAMGLTQKLMIFACVPLGVWGLVRLLRPFGSQRASLVGGLAYLAAALPWNALALGRWGALVVYAGGPWVLALLFGATGTAPFARIGPGAGRILTSDLDAVDPAGRRPSALRRFSAWTVRHGRVRSVVALGLLEAVLVSFVPAAAVVVLLAALALALSSLVYGDWRSTGKAAALAAGSTLVAALICLPWLIGVLSAGRGAVAVFGVPTPVSEAASWGSLLRFAVGPIGDSPLAWGFAAAAVVPLVLARGERFRWAGRLWSIALVFWLAAWATGRGWTGGLAIDPLVLLGPAAVAVAAAIGLGVAAFEEDLRAADFGWRQLVTVVATGAVVLGAAPTLVAALPGRWGLPIDDFRQSVTWMRGQATNGSFRVLWLGDTRSLNQGSWSAGEGLAYATSDDGAPDARWLWNAAGPGPAVGLAGAITSARTGRTDQLGRLLAPAGVRYVALLTSLAPEIVGEQTPEVYPVPGDLAPALDRQLDLSPVVSGTGITVYANADWVPVRAEVAGGKGAAVTPPGPGVLASPSGSGILAGATPVLPGRAASRSYTGRLSVGTVHSALAPAGRWALTGPQGTPESRTPSFGWAAKYRVTTAGVGSLHFDGGVVGPASLLFSIAAWTAAIIFLTGRWGRPWQRRRNGRRRAGGRGPGGASGSGPEPPPDGSPVPERDS